MYNSPTSGMSSISGEFVPTTMKLKLAANICLGVTDSKKRTSHHLTAGSNSVFNKIRLIDTEQNHHFTDWSRLYSRSLFSHFVLSSCKRLFSYSLLNLESKKQNEMM